MNQSSPQSTVADIDPLPRTESDYWADRNATAARIASQIRRVKRGENFNDNRDTREPWDRSRTNPIRLKRLKQAGEIK